MVLSFTIAVLGMASACASSNPPSAETPAYHLIEKPALRLSGSRPPRYPPELLATGDTGTVVVRAVVKPTGHVDGKSIEVVSSAHPAFARAAVQAMRDSRFIPAEIVECRQVCQPGQPGKKVSQTVTIAFFFAPTPATVPP